MRRSAPDMAEKRVLLQSTSKKNNLARIYRKVNLEQKSFISTSQFDKRLILNKQEKFRQLRSQQNGQKTSMYQRNNFPHIPGSIPRLYPSSLSKPREVWSRKSLETPARRKLDLEFGKKVPKSQAKPSMGVIHRLSDPSSLEENSKITQRTSTENLFKNRLDQQHSNQKTFSRSKAYMVEDCLESPRNHSSVVNVGDIIRYGGYDRRGLHNGGNAGLEKNVETMVLHSEVTPLPQSKNSQNTSPRKQNTTKQNPQVSITFEENSTRSPNEETDKEVHEKKPKPTDKRINFNKPNSSTKTTKRFPMSSLDTCLLRRGSICDVKTFTSGRVLDDLLFNLEEQTREKKSNYLNVEDLKYCRYLRSATPSEDERDSSEDTPAKYRPSKNIIIGHTKVSLQ